MSKSTLVEEDDQFFNSLLDLIPRRFLVPLTDEEKDQRHEKLLTKKSKKQTTKQVKQLPTIKRKRVFNGLKSNSELLEEATKKQKLIDEKYAKEILPNEKVKKHVTLEDTSLTELRARLANKIQDHRKKAGIPGARAERDKLLPPREPKKPRIQSNNNNNKEGGEEVKGDNDKKNLDKNDNNKRNKDDESVNKKEALEAKISYGALKLDGETKKSNDGKRSETSTRSILNVKKLLKKAQDGQARLEALKSAGKNEIVNNEKWDNLEKKAAGEKIRDDPKLLKKALKRLEKKKVKSSKEWQERKNTVEEEKKDRADTRQQNISDRKAKKHDKPSKEGAAKKPRSRPGFEGKKNNSHIKSDRNRNSSKGDHKKSKASSSHEKKD